MNKHDEMAREIAGEFSSLLSVSDSDDLKETIASALRQVERETLENRQATVYLTPPMLREALEFFTPDKTADDDETEIAIGYRNHVIDDDGNDTGRHLCMWFADYPDEGVTPLDGKGYEFAANELPTTQELAERETLERRIDIERLAALEHEQWAHWTKYMLDNLTADNITRWRRQIDTEYSDLSESEKQSDRNWAYRVVRSLSPTEDVSTEARRVCNACDWEGPQSKTVKCGAVGPLCPECHETTELADVSTPVKLIDREQTKSRLEQMLAQLHNAANECFKNNNAWLWQLVDGLIPEIRDLAAKVDKLGRDNLPGWTLVPIKHDGKAGPTNEMALAFWQAFQEANKKHGFYESFYAGYNAMIEVAPKHPVIDRDQE